MELWWKPGKVDVTKTRSAARGQPLSTRKFAISAIVLIWMLVSLACTGGFITTGELTQTAQSPQEAVPTMTSFVLETAVLSNQQPVATETPTIPPAIGGGISDPLPIVTVMGTADPAAETPVPEQPTPTTDTTKNPPILYYTQAGDTLQGLAARFNVDPAEIISPEYPIPEEGLFDPSVLLLIPRRLGDVVGDKPIIPDSEIVYSPSALDFDMQQFIQDAGGYLKTYQEWRVTGWHNGGQVIERVAIENSINPRLLLAVLDTQSHWVSGQPANLAQTDYPMGWLVPEKEKRTLYYQLSWAVQQLNIGYYGWRSGTVTELVFPNGEKVRLAPELNAGSVSLMYLFSKLYDQPQWAGMIYGPDGVLARYENMFGSSWVRAQSVEPLFPATLTQPPLELPYLPGRIWSLTGGPHSAWGPNGARAALDFAPSTTVHGCYQSDEWVTAVSSGLVVREDTGVIVLDLDGDGYEQTGWAILYLHVATKDRIRPGTWVNLNDTLGHPSCEGGSATGTHVHIARKYNGEWILSDGPMPFVLSGWRSHADPQNYKGTMTKDDKTVYSSDVGSYESLITRPRTSP